MKNKIKILSLLSVILLFSLTLVPITIGRSIVTNEQCDNNIETQTPSNYYAVIAGCSKYKDPSSNLPIAEWKLKSFYNALLSAPNWNKENIILLIGDSDDYPKNQNMFNGGATRENILAALDEMSGRVGSNDIFVFSWQGHGSEIPDEDGDEGFLDRYDEVICPYDCTRIYTSELINYISDDELDSKFDKIQAKGMLLMFESCLSSGLVDDIILSELAGTDGIIDENEAEYINNEFKEDFEQQGQSDDVNGPNRIVLTSTFGGFIKETLGLASWIYGFAMTATMAQAIKKYSAGIGPADDKNKDGYISAEEAIKWLKPKMLVRNSMLWGFIWSIFFTEELYISELMGDPDPIGAAINATKMFIFEFCYCQFIFRVSTGHFALNWPTSLDQFSGELQLVKTSQSNSEDDEVEIPALPNMLWEKPEYSQLTEDFRQIISKEKYESHSWDDIPLDEWPMFEVKATYSKDTGASKTINFEGYIAGGPEEGTKYSWDFGDGQKSTEQNPSHTYEKDGKYKVTLSVTDCKNRNSEYTIKDIKVGKAKSLGLAVFLEKISTLIPILAHIIKQRIYI